jgi:hypothetical protein
MLHDAFVANQLLTVGGVLTYMSILVELNKAIGNIALGDNGLVLMEPLLRSAPKKRKVYANKPVLEMLREPFSNDADGAVEALARGVVDRFISADTTLTVGLDPFTKRHDAILARVHPPDHECWDIRCLIPNDQIRIFGRFAEFDTFVALHWDYRDNLRTRQDWKDAVHETRQRWGAIFTQAPLTKTRAADYVSQPFESV